MAEPSYARMRQVAVTWCRRAAGLVRELQCLDGLVASRKANRRRRRNVSTVPGGRVPCIDDVGRASAGQLNCRAHVMRSRAGNGELGGICDEDAAETPKNRSVRPALCVWMTAKRP